MSTLLLKNNDVTGVMESVNQFRPTVEHTTSNLLVKVDGVWRRLYIEMDNFEVPPFYIIDGTRPVYLSTDDVEKFDLHNRVFS